MNAQHLDQRTQDSGSRLGFIISILILLSLLAVLFLRGDLFVTAKGERTSQRGQQLGTGDHYHEPAGIYESN